MFLLYAYGIPKIIQYLYHCKKRGVSSGRKGFIQAGPIKVKFMEGFDNKYITIGFDLVGNLLEIMYNRINSETIKVFHAMKCRKQFREELGI